MELSLPVVLIIAAVIGIICFFIGGYYKQTSGEGKLRNAEQTANKMVEDALKEGERIKKDKSAKKLLNEIILPLFNTSATASMSAPSKWGHFL